MRQSQGHYFQMPLNKLGLKLLIIIIVLLARIRLFSLFNYSLRNWSLWSLYYCGSYRWPSIFCCYVFWWILIQKLDNITSRPAWWQSPLVWNVCSLQFTWTCASITSLCYSKATTCKWTNLFGYFINSQPFLVSTLCKCFLETSADSLACATVFCVMDTSCE